MPLRGADERIFFPMQSMTSDEIRETFLSFFESKNHLRHSSSSLVPDDPTLLTTSAGMVQFKPYFLGLKKPPKTRLTTSQKCLRAVDIEEVGRTPRHHTFFEMLGNFSFGDYFKEDAIKWAWELLTEGYRIPADRMKISVFEDDDEAAKIWLDQVGIPSERLYYLGESENYWPASAPSRGPNGPCGPCSEIFFDFGEERGCGKPECDVSCDCGRYIEIWNLVFMQFERHDGGKLTPLPKKNIDTGSGLERMASVLQGKPTNFETDLLFPIINEIESISGVQYDKNPVPMRVVADHVRGCSFLISDGVFPSNEGRGYLLRKILRRAATFARDIGIDRPFLSSLVPVVSELMGKQYPGLSEKEDFVVNIMRKEEEQFQEALQQGRSFVISHEKELAGKDEKKGLADGSIIFTAYDTYGLPVEESEKIVREMGFSGVDRDGFRNAMEQQKERSRRGSKMDGSVFAEDDQKIYRDAVEGKEAGIFDGYEKIEMEATVESIVIDGNLAEEAEKGQTANVIFDRTPFYGEMGGQVGDRGEGKFDGGSFRVTDTSMADGHIVVHTIEVTGGTLSTGARATLKVDPERRAAIMRHHTATHILHAALRQVLGNHVVQSGSYVGPDKLRFDFTHHEAVTPEQLKEIEDLVNSIVLKAIPVSSATRSYAEAKKEGAMALFGEKYGDEVRTVGIGEFSLELCGGTHVSNTAEVGPVKITEERSVGSSMRRIEALAGKATLDYFNEKLELLSSAAAAANVQDTELPGAVASMREQVAEAKKRLKKQDQAGTKDIGVKLLDSAEDVGGVSLIAAAVEGFDADTLRNLYDELKVRLDSYAVLLGSSPGGKAALVLAFSDDVVKKGLNAGKLIKEIARVASGGGGGSPQMAQAGGKSGDKVAEAVKKGSELLKDKLSS